MPKTPNGLPYPAGTDLVRDGDNVIAALATALRYAAGSVVVNGNNQPFAVANVTFPPSLFTAAPHVTTSGVANTTGSTLSAQPIAITTAGCSIRLAAGGANFAGNYTIQWIAVQMPS